MKQIFLVAAMLWGAGHASAEVVTFDFTGTLSSAGGGVGFDLSPFGSTMTGSWSFDSNAIGAVSLEGTVYPYLSFAAQTGTFSFSAPASDGGIDVFHDPSDGDDIQVFASAATAPADGAFTLSTVDLDLAAPYNSVFSSTALPLTALDPNVFTFEHAIQMVFSDNSGDFEQVFYTIDTITSGTPEPASVTLLVIGIGMLGILLSRKRRAVSRG